MGVTGADGGKVVEEDGQQVLGFERGFEASRDAVWMAITDPELTGKWGFSASFEPKAGGTVTFDYGGGMTAGGTVHAWADGETVEYEWEAEPGTNWRVRYSLADEGAGTSLSFRHLAPQPNADTAAGWHWYLDRLAELVGGGSPAQVMQDEKFEALQEDYRTLLAG